MTDPTDPTDELDELDALASDHLDGHTTEAEAARIAADPVLAARVASLEAARAALRAEVPVDGAARTAAIAAALDAFDAAGVQERSTGLAPVTMPAGGRAPSRRALQLVAIAAALVLLALAVPLLSSLDRSDDDDDEAATALDADTFGEAGGDLESSAPPAPSVAEDSATDGAAQAYNADSPVELGAFPDVDALRDAVRAAAPAPTSRAVPSTTAADVPGRAGTADESLSASPCAEEVAARAPTFSARATVEGRDVLALVQVTAAGTAELVVLDAATCSVVTSRPL